MSKYLSGRVKRVSQSELSADRYRYLGLNQAEPNLGDPSLTVTPPFGTQYQLISLLENPGERYWIPVGGGLIPGSISIYDEGILTPPGGISSITQLNFVGAAISAKGYSYPSGAPGIGVTIRVFSPGNTGELLFNVNNEFTTSSNLVFDSNSGILTTGKSFNVGFGGTMFTVTGIGSVGIGTTNPTQELDINGDIRLRGTIYDYLNSPGDTSYILSKNSLNGVLWISQKSIRAGAGGTYGSVQYHNSAGLVDGALNFFYDDINGRVGIGSTIPQYLLDVFGYSRFKGQTEIDYLRVTGISTITTLGVSGLTTTRNLNVIGVSTFNDFVNVNNNLYISGVTTSNNLTVVGTTILGVTTATNLTIQQLNVSGITTLSADLFVDTNTLVVKSSSDRVGIGTTNPLQRFQIGTANTLGINTNGTVFVVTSNADVGIGTTNPTSKLHVFGDGLFSGTGIVTATRFVGDFQGVNNKFTNIEVTGIATIATLGVSGITTTKDLRVTGVTTLGITTATNITAQNLNISGITTLNGAYINNVTISGNSITTPTGNLILDSAAGTTQINDAVYVNDSTNSTNKDTGSIVTEGGVGIEKNLNVGGSVSISTTTESTNKDSGALIVEGGVGIEKNLNVGGASYISGITTFGSNVLPFSNETQDLGASDKKWQTVYTKSISTGIVNIQDYIQTVNLNVTGVGTIATLGVSTLGVSGLTTTRNLLVTGIATIGTLGVTGLTTSKNLVVTGISTLGSVKIDLSTITTTSGDLTLDSATGTTKIDDALTISGATTISNTTESTNKDSGALIVEGGVGIEKNLNVGGASSISGIVTFGSSVLPFNNGTQDLGSSTQKWNVVYANTVNLGDVITQESISTKNLNVSGIATIATLGVTGLTTSKNLVVTGISTLGSVKIDLSTITTTSGDLTLDSATGTTKIDDTLTVTGSVTLGNDLLTDTVTFTSKVNSNIIPSGTVNLGSDDNKWDNVWATTFNGDFVGTADKADQLSTPRNIDIDGDVIGVGIGTAFDGSKDVVIQTTLKSQGITPNVYGSATTVPVLGINTAGIITSITTASVVNIPGNADTASRLATPRNIDIDGDVIGVGIGTTFDGSRNVVIQTTLKSQGITPNVYGNATTVPVLGINTAGIITSITTASVVNISGNAATASRLATPRNIDIDGDVIGVGIGTTFDGSRDVVIQTTLKSQGITPNVYGSSGSIPVLGINASGIITSVTTASVSAATVAKANQILTQRTVTSNIYFLTFVNSNNDVADYESLNTHSDISFNSNGSILNVGKIKPGEIRDNSDSSGSVNQILTISSTNAGQLVWKNPNQVSVSRATYADEAGIATNLKAGGAGQLVYQNGTDSTAFLATPTDKFILQYDATNTRPKWVSATSITAGVSTIADNLSTNASKRLLYQNAINDTRALAPGNAGEVLVSQGPTDIPTWTSPGTLSAKAAGSDTQVQFNDGGTLLGASASFTFNKTTELLTVTKIKPSQILQSDNGTGNSGYVITANGSGGWSWQAQTGGSAISGITIRDEGVTQGTSGIVTTLNFTGSAISATASGNTATINVPGVTVTQTGYSGVNPITTIGNAVSIANTSNAYGTRYISAGIPLSTLGSVGDIYYQIP